ncbi:oxidoreductase [Asanoa ishikariensis]|uniref:Uncharacterized protein n=1 Tax=Asanoa ishikariensis TaxID=137265 RepID=A0A1H3NB51_9ACTN|nr:hypothetical protein [Asanoa ishikariensis]GIF68738.1 oxidoreductase [Asanoa ishikariensis]SDY86106.1 hypothetical protein SAMN05421684_1956 [Asanoa ishikariensis]
MHTAVEQRLIAAVGAGDLLDLAGDGPVDEAAMHSWGAERTISAEVIRELVRGRLAGDPDPHGIRLRGARIAGRIDLENITSDVAVELRDCLLPDGLTLQNAQLRAVALVGCRIEQTVEATRLTARTSFSLSGSTVTGAVRLLAAHVGTLDCGGARLESDEGPALDADGLRTDQSVFLRNGFSAVSGSERGTVRLLGAEIAGQLNCRGARMENSAGAALDIGNARVSREVLLSDGFTAVAAAAEGAIRLIGAQLGALSCGGARIANDSGPAIVGDGLHIDRDLALDWGFRATGAGDRAVVELPFVRVGGSLALEIDGITSVDLDGLTYTGLPWPTSARRWLTLLRDHTPGYSAQAYQQLAGAYRTAGHDRDARAILIAQRRDQIQRAGLSRSERAWSRVTGFTLGYGYQPWRALLLLLATLAAAVVLSVVGGHHGGLAQKPGTAACSTVDQIGVGLDLGTPLLKTGARDRCQPTATATGQTLTVAGWLLQLFAWTFATLFIAGFTSAVRKT